MPEKRLIDTLICKCRMVEHHQFMDGKHCQCEASDSKTLIVPTIFARTDAEPNAKVLAEIISDTVNDYLEMDGRGDDIACFVSAGGQRAIERELQKGGVT